MFEDERKLWGEGKDPKIYFYHANLFWKSQSQQLKELRTTEGYERF